MAKRDSIMTFQRGTTLELEKIDKLDGQVLFDTDRKQILVDEESKRIIYSGKDKATDIKLGRSYVDNDFRYKLKSGTIRDTDSIVGTVIDGAEDTATIIHDLIERIGLLSYRVYDLEQLISGGKLTDYAKVTDLNDYIKKSELGFTLSGSNLTINKKY